MNQPGTLFEPVPTDAAAIGPHSATLDRTAAAHEADDDVEARQALGAYLVLRAIDRLIALQREDSPEARDGFRFQVASVTRFVEDLPQVGHVEASHLAGLVKVLGAFDREGERRLRIGLLAYSWHLEQAGHLEEALDVVGLSEPFYREAGPHELTNLGMTSGRFHRTLAHWDLADRSYQLGYESAEVRHDRRGMLLARLGRAKVLLGRGNLPEARRQIEGVIAEAEGKNLADARACGYSDLAAVLEKMGMPAEAVHANYQALMLFREPNERGRLFGNLGSGLRAIGMLDLSQIAFEQVLREASQWQPRLNAMIELTGIHAAHGDELAFRRYWSEVERDENRMAPSTAVDFHVTVASGLVRFGRPAVARRQLELASGLAERHGLNAWYFTIERLLQELDEGPASIPSPKPDPAISKHEYLREVADGLRRHALSV
ncbi:MAG: hypothetical protein ACREL4_01090 [Gemmatimonadales bacterium]